MATAIEHISKMRGGAQAHLMRCTYKPRPGDSEGSGYFVVKFRNNPQGVRILANELLCYRLARALDLPAPHAEEVEVSQALLDASPAACFELAGRRGPCAAGRHFGSQYPGNPRTTLVFDYVPDATLAELENANAFWGMLAFDQWTCNTNGRQVVFVPNPDSGRYRALMIDQGFCFNDGEWSFPDAPLRGLYMRRQVYHGVRGWESFEPWLSRIESLDTADLFDRLAAGTPSAWCAEGDGVDLEKGRSALDELLDTLGRRRRRVRELLLAVKRSSADPFPEWR